MTDKDIYLWRITIKPASQDKKSFEFCLQNNILGVGWCLRKEDGTPYTPASIEECERWGAGAVRVPARLCDGHSRLEGNGGGRPDLDAAQRRILSVPRGEHLEI